jgi:hypothetical protein
MLFYTEMYRHGIERIAPALLGVRATSIYTSRLQLELKQVCHTRMFIAIIGTRLSGKSTIEAYLIEKGFVSVGIIPRAVNHEARAEEMRSVVSCLRAHFSVC